MPPGDSTKGSEVVPKRFPDASITRGAAGQASPGDRSKTCSVPPGASQVAAVVEAGEADDGTASVGAPVGGEKAGEGGDEIDAAVIGDGVGEVGFEGEGVAHHLLSGRQGRAVYLHLQPAVGGEDGGHEDVGEKPQPV